MGRVQGRERTETEYVHSLDLARRGARANLRERNTEGAQETQRQTEGKSVGEQRGSQRTYRK